MAKGNCWFKISVGLSQHAPTDIDRRTCRLDLNWKSFFFFFVVYVEKRGWWNPSGVARLSVKIKVNFKDSSELKVQPRVCNIEC